MDLNSLKCPFCDLHYILVSLQKHCIRTHKIESEILYLTLFCNNTKPVCACGCGGPVKFHNVVSGYSKFRRGHQSRVSNNWGNNKKALDKSHETCRKKREAGEMEAWNKGLTKGTDSRVALYGINGSKSIKADLQECQARSRKMKIQFEQGNIVPLRGPNHSRWKGGVSALQNICRSYVTNVWTQPKLKEANYTCQKCSSKDNLNVHHSGERFVDIVRIYATKYNWTGDESEFDKKIMIAESVADHHSEKNIPGIVVCHECHIKIHAELGETIN